LPAHAAWFGEDQARYVIAVPADDVDAVGAAASAAGVPVRVLGTVEGDSIALPGETALALTALKAAHEGWMPRFMA
jgi:phosphoribosylformylglycinamidine synthase